MSSKPASVGLWVKVVCSKLRKVRTSMNADCRIVEPWTASLETGNHGRKAQTGTDGRYEIPNSCQRDLLRGNDSSRAFHLETPLPDSSGVNAMTTFPASMFNTHANVLLSPTLPLVWRRHSGAGREFWNDESGASADLLMSSGFSESPELEISFPAVRLSVARRVI